MDQSLTEQIARERGYNYLRETLAALPPGVSLSYHPDNPVLGALGPENPVPCNDSNTVEHGPMNVTSGYWLVGVPAGQGRHYFDLITQLWSGWGWRESPGADMKWAAFNNTDGYSLVIQDAGKGDGSLSLTTTSPCFPESAAGTTTPEPSVIEHPSGR
ncbi:hypothetical protein [Speluncibacter jeojiensis]|uniref:Uncharacterized protein n=1 Tax=Speluncibacter jeojiensis TaxID=2710754 RepID=A0A9X4REE5_9ACTN|nr:hypothetical protein [Corynebacteriales bacterium D3-21]